MTQDAGGLWEGTMPWKWGWALSRGPGGSVLRSSTRLNLRTWVWAGKRWGWRWWSALHSTSKLGSHHETVRLAVDAQEWAWGRMASESLGSDSHRVPGMWGVLQSSMKVDLVVLGKSDLWKRERSLWVLSPWVSGRQPVFWAVRPWRRCRFRRVWIGDLGQGIFEVPIQHPWGIFKKQKGTSWNRDLEPRSPKTAPISGASRGFPGLSPKPIPCSPGVYRLRSKQGCLTSPAVEGHWWIQAHPVCHFTLDRWDIWDTWY